MIPIEVGEPSLRRKMFDLSLKNESLTTNLEVSNELRDKSQIKDRACEVKVAIRYNSSIPSWRFGMAAVERHPED